MELLELMDVVLLCFFSLLVHSMSYVVLRAKLVDMVLAGDRMLLNQSGRAMSMTRLDQLSKPIRRNGEHICAIVEREKRMHLEANGEQPWDDGLGGGDKRRMSRSMTHLTAAGSGSHKRTSSGTASGGLQKSASNARVGSGSRQSLGGSRLKPAKSLCHLDGSGGPGFHRIITKVAQHFIRNGSNSARGKDREATTTTSSTTTHKQSGSFGHHQGWREEERSRQ